MFEATRKLIPLSTYKRRPTAVSPEPIYSPERTQKMRSAVEYVRERRRVFEPVRTKLRALTSAMDTMSLSTNEKRFVDELVKYFPDGELSETRTSDSQSLLDQIEYYSDAKIVDLRDSELADAGSTLPSLIDSLIERHRYQWSSVCEAYATLKVAASDQK
jgi:hypothetical protein